MRLTVSLQSLRKAEYGPAHDVRKHGEVVVNLKKYGASLACGLRSITIG
jgi:hypothetical protein